MLRLFFGRRASGGTASRSGTEQPQQSQQQARTSSSSADESDATSPPPSTAGDSPADTSPPSRPLSVVARPPPPSTPAPSDLDAPQDPAALEAASLARRTSSTATFSATARRRFKLDDFEIGACIGRGFFSEVHVVRHKRTNVKFALKQIKEVSDTAARVAFMKEVEMLIRLRHPNVLQFSAVFVSDHSLHLLTEFLEGGTLRKLLKAKDTIPLSYTERWRLALELALGMEYIHASDVMHRDLKSKNCLLTADRTLVIADLGLAHVVASGANLNESAGTAYWMAPEILHGEPYGKAADVFSYGIVLCEIITRLKATPDEIPRVNSFALDEKAFRPLCGECPEKLVQLAFDCCQLDPAVRPTFPAIVKRLRSMSHVDLVALGRGGGDADDDNGDKSDDADNDEDTTAEMSAASPDAAAPHAAADASAATDAAPDDAPHDAQDAATASDLAPA